MTVKNIIPEWLRITDASDNFGISRSGLYRLAGCGEIELRKIGARTVVNVGSLRGFIERQPQLKPRQDPFRKSRRIARQFEAIGNSGDLQQTKALAQ